ncbi:hypothetical protein BpHYR1_021331 [Brachionus plicatilis]|uniref:Uncharacterized protein n=1 Tax=Brachionus plicatilis TaxID=10195 RepID=A0A3M7QUT2_BRAPC|nr:hypothetical protein BpHYR1_021331 [Brachionus plicatilis]
MDYDRIETNFTTPLFERLYDFQILFQTKKYQKVMMVCSDDWSKLLNVSNIKNELVSRYEHVENQLIELFLENSRQYTYTSYKFFSIYSPTTVMSFMSEFIISWVFKELLKLIQSKSNQV